MRVHVRAPEKLSRAMHRVANALELEGVEAGFELVSRPEDAELVVLHVIGYPETVRAVEALKAAGKRYAILQYCLRSTQEPRVPEWLELWRGSVGVWSYYDLEALAAEDGVELDGVPFYMAPLGVDSRIFNAGAGELEVPAPPRFVITTSGYVAATEGIKEAAAATRRARRRMYHLGPDLGLGAWVARGLDISDHELARIYRRSDYVAGLRRAEGFELPAAEGLLCGARPICFDRPHYRDHYGRWAYFVNEGTPEELEEELLGLFECEPEPLTADELEEARQYFSWSRVCSGFYRNILELLEDHHREA
jgi:hypothetical protein